MESAQPSAGMGWADDDGGGQGILAAIEGDRATVHLQDVSAVAQMGKGDVVSQQSHLGPAEPAPRTRGTSPASRNGRKIGVMERPPNHSSELPGDHGEVSIVIEPPYEDVNEDATEKGFDSPTGLTPVRSERRTRSLRQCKEIILVTFPTTPVLIDKDQFEKLLHDRDFCDNFFALFDETGSGGMTCEEWTAILKLNSSREQREIVDLLEAVAYLICKKDKLDASKFHAVLSTAGIGAEVFKLINGCHHERCAVEEIVSFLARISQRRCGIETTDSLERIFDRHLSSGKNTLTVDDFKRAIAFRNPYFVERIFHIFDEERTGVVSRQAFLRTMRKFVGPSLDEKVDILFRMYDRNDDGYIERGDLQEMIKACMDENGMHFDASQIEELATALYDDALPQDACDDSRQGITLDEFKAQLSKHDGLLENLSTNIGKWLLLPDTSHSHSRSWRERLFPPQLSPAYLKNNKQLVFFVVIFVVLINAVLFVNRAHFFRDFAMLSGFKPNLLYVLSRACGQVLMYNSVLILLLVLRHTITILRNLGLGSNLPLDNHIYLHKVIGYVIFAFAWIHTIMHLCNCAVNVQPDPIKFLQLTSKYWESFGPRALGWTNLPYEPPVGCEITDRDCPDSSVIPELNVTHCQVCQLDARPWTYQEWILTDRPRVFGLIPGWANPTGLALIAVLTVMVVCSLPFVRRGGYFEVFYFTHCLHVVYWILMILHAPEFWKWILAPGTMFLLEILFRLLNSLMGRGKTTVSAGILLPSRVTSLIIKKPNNFNFSPGDWVFIKIPSIALFEWHPFTISSAPEQADFFTVHVRGVGEWTNRLNDYFEDEYKRQNGQGTDAPGLKETLSKNLSKVQRRLSTVTVISDSVMPTAAKVMTNPIHRPSGNAPQVDFQAIASRYQTPEARTHRTGNADSISRYLAVPVPNVDEECHHDFSDDCSDNKSTVSEVQNFRKISRMSFGRVVPKEDFLHDSPGKKTTLHKPLNVFVDGPFGAPSSNIFRAEHAVLIATGIGVTPFASILQSIMHRYWHAKRQCPRCDYRWSDDIPTNLFSLKKVDFFWINRDQKSFEWFVQLLSQLEMEQAESGGLMGHFLEIHMYITSALEKTDMKAVGLQLALDLLYKKEKRHLVTGLRSRTNAGRPNWNKVFTQLREQKKGRVTVFFCGNPVLARVLRKKCGEFGFGFKKESF